MFGFLCMLPVANHQGMQSPQPSGSCFSKFWNAGRDGGQAIWSSSLWYLNKWWSGKSPCFSSVHHWTDRQSYKAVMNIVKEVHICLSMLFLFRLVLKQQDHPTIDISSSQWTFNPSSQRNGCLVSSEEKAYDNPGLTWTALLALGRALILVADCHFFGVINPVSNPGLSVDIRVEASEKTLISVGSMFCLFFCGRFSTGLTIICFGSRQRRWLCLLFVPRGDSKICWWLGLVCYCSKKLR